MFVRVLTGPRPVWNLAVDGNHEYYANGVLVHNCDAMRYACLGVDKDYGAVEAPPDLALAAKEEKDERERLQAEWLSPWNDELYGAWA